MKHCKGIFSLNRYSESSACQTTVCTLNCIVAFVDLCKSLLFDPEMCLSLQLWAATPRDYKGQWRICLWNRACMTYSVTIKADLKLMMVLHCRTEWSTVRNSNWTECSSINSGSNCTSNFKINRFWLNCPAGFSPFCHFFFFTQNKGVGGGGVGKGMPLP